MEKGVNQEVEWPVFGNIKMENPIIFFSGSEEAFMLHTLMTRIINSEISK